MKKTTTMKLVGLMLIAAGIFAAQQSFMNEAIGSGWKTLLLITGINMVMFGLGSYCIAEEDEK